MSAARLESMLKNRNLTPDQLADAHTLSVDPHRCVTEDHELTLDDLIALGKFFKRPWSALLIDAPEVIDAKGVDNRSLRNQKVPPSPALIDQLEAVAAMLETAADLFPETRFAVPTGVSASTPPGAAARAIRTFLGVGDTEQVGAKDEYAALRLWADAFHRRGVYVSQRRLDDHTVRAFSRIDGEHAVVVVDTGDGAYARIFSLLHEYVHLTLRTAGICDLDDHSRVERFCNTVAAQVLMPTKLVKRLLGARAFDGDPENDDDLLRRLSNRLRVSQASLLIRLRELRIISQPHYDDIEERRAQRRPDDSKAPGGTYYPVRINRVGRRFAREVFGALDDGEINGQDASAALEIGEHLLRPYRRALDSSGARS